LLKCVLVFTNFFYRHVEQYIFCESITNMGTVPQFRGLLEEMDTRQNRRSWWGTTKPCIYGHLDF